MGVLKAMIIAAALTGTIALVLGSQGSSLAFLNIEMMIINNHRLFWSWPLFLSGTGLFWGLTLLQK